MNREKDKNTSGLANETRSHLRLVETSVEARKSEQMSEAASRELRELIDDIRRTTPRRKMPDDPVSLPPAA